MLDEPNPADPPTGDEASPPTTPAPTSDPAPTEPKMSDFKSKAAELLAAVKADAVAANALNELPVAHQRIVEGACASLAKSTDASSVASVKLSIVGGPHVQNVVRTSKRKVYQTDAAGKVLTDKNGQALLKYDIATGAVVEEEFQETVQETATAPALAGGEAIWKALSAAAGV